MDLRRAWGVGAAAVGFALVTWVTAAGSVAPLSAPVGALPVPSPATASTPVAPPPSVLAQNSPQPSWWLPGLAFDWLGPAVRVLVVLLMLGILLALLRRLPRRRGARAPIPAPVGAPPAPPDLPSAVVEDAAAQEEVLARGTARNAVVACWLRLEAAAGAAGLARLPAETSSEFTERILAGHAVHPEAIAELAGLYREARFSRHDMGEPQRARALAALRALHDDLGRRPVVPAGGPGSTGVDAPPGAGGAGGARR